MRKVSVNTAASWHGFKGNRRGWSEAPKWGCKLRENYSAVKIFALTTVLGMSLLTTSLALRRDQSVWLPNWGECTCYRCLQNREIWALPQHVEATVSSLNNITCAFKLRFNEVSISRLVNLCWTFQVARLSYCLAMEYSEELNSITGLTFVLKRIHSLHLKVSVTCISPTCLLSFAT